MLIHEISTSLGANLRKVLNSSDHSAEKMQFEDFKLLSHPLHKFTRCPLPSCKRFLLLSPRKKKQQMLSYFLRLSPEVTSWLYDKAKWSSLTKRNKGGRSAVGTASSEDADDAENEAVPPPRKVL